MFFYFLFQTCDTTSYFFFFFFNDTATTEIYTLSLHDALPISPTSWMREPIAAPKTTKYNEVEITGEMTLCISVRRVRADRKSTRLNSSHLGISYAVFCLKKKKIKVILSASRVICHFKSCISHP